MKKLLVFLVISNFCIAQVAIEKSVVDGSGILDFASGTTKGIILPNVVNNNSMTNVTPGTLVFDNTSAKVKYFDGFWKELSTNTGIAPARLAGTDVITEKGVVIGNTPTTAEGVLVLESQNLALILPKIDNPVTNVKSPVAGMICYDPIKKVMSVYNGKEWFFWK